MVPGNIPMSEGNISLFFQVTIVLGTVVLALRFLTFMCFLCPGL